MIGPENYNTVLVVGSREYPSYLDVSLFVERLKAGTCVLSGGARGVDSWSIRAAEEAGLATRVMKADWNKGPSAGFRRNAEMVASGPDWVVAFWDGKSSGTLDTLCRALRAEIPTTVYIRATLEDTRRCLAARNHPAIVQALAEGVGEPDRFFVGAGRHARSS